VLVRHLDYSIYGFMQIWLYCGLTCPVFSSAWQLMAQVFSIELNKIFYSSLGYIEMSIYGSVTDQHASKSKLLSKLRSKSLIYQISKKSVERLLGYMENPFYDFTAIRPFFCGRM
jgi:hypothetical protein